MISMRKRKLSIDKKVLVYQKTNGICIICKKAVNDKEKWNMEHYIPRAIYKWIPSPTLKQSIESLDNLFIVHQKCNHHKNADLPTITAIQHLSISDTLKTALIQLYQSIEKEISAYNNIKQNILLSQRSRCFFCHRKIHLSNSTLRRKDNQKQRVADNAMCLCFSCSVKAGRPSYKSKMVKERSKQQKCT